MSDKVFFRHSYQRYGFGFIYPYVEVKSTHERVYLQASEKVPIEFEFKLRENIRKPAL